MAQKPFDPVEIVESLAGETAVMVREIGIAVLSAVVTTTPVGDPKLWQYPPKPGSGYVGGHARRNWIVTLGQPLAGTQAQGSGGRGKAEATAKAMKQGKSRINQYRSGKDSRIIIQNNVPYITRLNAGHSTQAPANFVETAVMVGRNVGRNDRKELP